MFFHLCLSSLSVLCMSSASVGGQEISSYDSGVAIVVKVLSPIQMYKLTSLVHSRFTGPKSQVTSLFWHLWKRSFREAIA